MAALLQRLPRLLEPSTARGRRETSRQAAAGNGLLAATQTWHNLSYLIVFYSRDAVLSSVSTSREASYTQTSSFGAHSTFFRASVPSSSPCFLLHKLNSPRFQTTFQPQLAFNFHHFKVSYFVTSTTAHQGINQNQPSFNRNCGETLPEHLSDISFWQI